MLPLIIIIWFSHNLIFLEKKKDIKKEFCFEKKFIIDRSTLKFFFSVYISILEIIIIKFLNMRLFNETKASNRE